MKDINVVRSVLVSLAVLGFCLPQPVLAAGVTAEQEQIATDVELSNDGVLLGQVVDLQGVAVVNVPVSIGRQSREIATTMTDNQGYFAIGGLGGGVYQIVAAGSHRAYRLWSPGTAPPLSEQGVLVVAESETVRGQLGGSALGFWFSNPMVIAGVAATAAASTAIVSVANDTPSSP